jgi:hypothetical protein
MGMLNDYELTANFLAGGLGGTHVRLDRTMDRVRACRPRDAQGDPEPPGPDYHSPSYAAAVLQALSDLIDAWQSMRARPKRFRETERLLLLLKDRTLDSLAPKKAIWSDFYRLAQCLNELKLDRGPDKSPLRL